MAFNYAIGNTDDHLQNHGFLFDGAWRLAPAFDLVAIGGNAMAIGLGRRGRERTRANLLSGIGDFGLKPGDASAIFDEVITAARGLGEALDQQGVAAGERAQVLRAICDEAKGADP